LAPFEIKTNMSPLEGRATFKEMLEAVAALHEAGSAHGHLSRASFDASGHLVSPDGQMLVRRGRRGSQGGASHCVVQAVTGWSPLSTWQVEASHVRATVEEALVYRAPEELVQGVSNLLSCSASPTSAQAVDMWAMGCILAELVNGGVPLFEQAETNFDLLSLHCDLFGFNYTSDDLEVSSPLDSGKDSATLTRDSLRDLINSDLCHHGFDLLSSLLSCDWASRPSSHYALAHPFLSWQCSCPLGQGQHAHEAVETSSPSDPRHYASEVCVSECCRMPSTDSRRCEAIDTPSFELSYPSLLSASGFDGCGGDSASAVLQELLRERRRKRAGCPVEGPKAVTGKRQRLAPPVGPL
jgi:serine/threonine protein kinase